MFIEHIPRAERLQVTVQLQQRDISADAHRTGAIAYTVFVYGHIQGVGVTAYCIQQRTYCEAEEAGPNVTNNEK